MTLFVTPLEWLDAFESMDLKLGPSDTVSDLVHLNRRQRSGSSSGSSPSPPSGGSQSRPSGLGSSLMGNIFPHQGNASASDNNLSIDCERACSVDEALEITTGAFKFRRRRGSVEISEALTQAVVRSLEASVPFRVTMTEPREMNVEIPLVLERICFLPIEVRQLRAVNQSADRNNRYRNCSRSGPQWPQSLPSPSRVRRLLISHTASMRR